MDYWRALSCMPRHFCALAASILLLSACSGSVDGTNTPGVGAGGGSGGALAPGGASGSGGAITPQGGSAGAPAMTGGSAGAASAGSGGGGAGGSAGSGPVVMLPAECDPWPTAGETVEASETIMVSGTFDGGMKRYVGTGSLGSDTQSEDLPAFFRLAEGSVLKNVIMGQPASDGIHCDGTCWLINVWWEDVGEDAATLDGTASSQVMTVDCAGARHAADKVLQHNGPGTMVVSRFYAEDFGKMYRSCGNCLEQYSRRAKLSNINAEDGEVIAGVNENYGDQVEFDAIYTSGGIDICWRYEGNDTGAEPDFIDGGSDPEHCLYDDSDLHDL
jgi:pectate lyase